MMDYVVRRFLLMGLVMTIASMLLFVVLYELPAIDMVERKLGEQVREDNPEVIEIERERLGLNRPLHERYIDWATGFVTGDWGNSFDTQTPIFDELKKRIPVSLELSLFTLFIVWATSLPLGILAAVKQDSPLDYVLRTCAYALDAIPSFVAGIFLLTFLAHQFHWAPAVSFKYLWEDPMEHFRIMVLPIVVIGVTSGGVLIRFVRAFMLEVMRQDYIRTARSKGLNEQNVLLKHALRNTAIPLVTIVGAQLPTILTSSAIIEILFSLPGMGRYLVTAAQQFDYNVVMTTTMFFGLLVLVANLVVDLSYAWLDPRISYRRGA